MVKKRNKRFNLSNRALYTFITFGIIIILAVGIYALTPGVAPNPGHLITDVAPPSNCSSGQFLQFNGSNWDCASVQQSSVLQGGLNVTIIQPPSDASFVNWVPILATVVNYSPVSVQFYLDDSPLGKFFTSPLYAMDWLSNETPDGNHTISVTATDSSGNHASDNVTIYLLNNASKNISSGFFCNYNGVCDVGETASTCVDCIPPQTSGSLSTYCNNNGYCEPQLGENSVNCGDCYSSGSIGGSGCFVPGTEISTPSGKVPIQDLKLGDEIFSVNTSSNKLVPEKILFIYSIPAVKTMRVVLSSGTVLVVTQEHPFYDPLSKSYKPIKDFKQGDKVLIFENSTAQESIISYIGFLPSYDGQPVYNMHVSGPFLNFLADNVLVHNKVAYPTEGGVSGSTSGSGGGNGGGGVCYSVLLGGGIPCNANVFFPGSAICASGDIITCS